MKIARYVETFCYVGMFNTINFAYYICLWVLQDVSEDPVDIQTAAESRPGRHLPRVGEGSAAAAAARVAEEVRVQTRQSGLALPIPILHLVYHKPCRTGGGDYVTSWVL